MKNENQDFFASELLKDMKRVNRRNSIFYFTIIIILLIMLSISFGYVVYLLNDIEVTTTETIQEITDVESIDGSTITNGE